MRHQDDNAVLIFILYDECGITELYRFGHTLGNMEHAGNICLRFG